MLSCLLMEFPWTRQSCWPDPDVHIEALKGKQLAPSLSDTDSIWSRSGLSLKIPSSYNPNDHLTVEMHPSTSCLVAPATPHHCVTAPFVPPLKPGNSELFWMTELFSTHPFPSVFVFALVNTIPLNQFVPFNNSASPLKDMSWLRHCQLHCFERCSWWLYMTMLFQITTAAVFHLLVSYMSPGLRAFIVDGKVLQI